MKFTEYLKRLFILYFVIVTCITAVYGIIGLLFFPEEKFGYEAFFSPFICGLISILPSFIRYSKKELSFRQTLVRKVIQYLLILGLLTFANSFNRFWGWTFFLMLAGSVLIVCILVDLVNYVLDYKKAEELSKYLKSYQHKNQ